MSAYLHGAKRKEERKFSPAHTNTPFINVRYTTKSEPENENSAFYLGGIVSFCCRFKNVPMKKEFLKTFIMVNLKYIQ